MTPPFYRMNRYEKVTMILFIRSEVAVLDAVKMELKK